MIMRIIAALKCDCDLRINAGAALAGEIFAGPEGEAIEASGGVKRKIRTAPVRVCLSVGYSYPVNTILLFQVAMEFWPRACPGLHRVRAL